MRQQDLQVHRRPQFSQRVRIAVMILVSLGLAFVSDSMAFAPSNDSFAKLQEKALAALKTVMHEGKRFEKVHAAEALIWAGRPEGVREYFVEQERIAGSEPLYRIGIWRVLYRLSADQPDVQKSYLHKIIAVFSDAQASDQGTAAETLGKLLYADRSERVLDLAENGKEDIRVSARWILANSGKAEDEARLAELLRSENPKDRYYTAYVFRHLKTIRPASLQALQKLADDEPADGAVRYYVLGTLYTHLPAAQREASRKELLAYAATGTTDQRYQACLALANAPDVDMLPVAEKLLACEPMDERVGGAFLILKMAAPPQ